MLVGDYARHERAMFVRSEQVMQSISNRAETIADATVIVCPDIEVFGPVFATIRDAYGLDARDTHGHTRLHAELRDSAIQTAGRHCSTPRSNWKPGY